MHVLIDARVVLEAYGLDIDVSDVSLLASQDGIISIKYISLYILVHLMWKRKGNDSIEDKTQGQQKASTYHSPLSRPLQRSTGHLSNPLQRWLWRAIR